MLKAGALDGLARRFAPGRLEGAQLVTRFSLELRVMLGPRPTSLRRR